MAGASGVDALSVALLYTIFFVPPSQVPSCLQLVDPSSPQSLRGSVPGPAARHLPAWPVALRLHAQVTSVRSDGNGFIICARLLGVSDTVKDWLEKLVFRRHRRAIAQQRVTRTVTAANASIDALPPVGVWVRGES